MTQTDEHDPDEELAPLPPLPEEDEFEDLLAEAVSEKHGLVDEDLTLDAPAGHPYFTVHSDGGVPNKTLHLVSQNHVSKKFDSWAFTEEEHEAGVKSRPTKKYRQFNFLTVETADVLRTAGGFRDCRQCHKAVERARALADLGPFIDRFRELAEEASDNNIEVRLMLYPETDFGTVGKGREIWSSLP